MNLLGFLKLARSLSCILGGERFAGGVAKLSALPLVPGVMAGVITLGVISGSGVGVVSLSLSCLAAANGAGAGGAGAVAPDPAARLANLEAEIARLRASKCHKHFKAMLATLTQGACAVCTSSSLQYVDLQVRNMGQHDIVHQSLLNEIYRHVLTAYKYTSRSE